AIALGSLWLIDQLGYSDVFQGPYLLLNYYLGAFMIVLGLRLVTGHRSALIRHGLNLCLALILAFLLIVMWRWPSQMHRAWGAWGTWRSDCVVQLGQSGEIQRFKESYPELHQRMYGVYCPTDQIE
ncbi:MAG: hypothetical protein CEO22_455, partial [Candidatus Berkelbacteria bacterium Gr01-1014_85]